MSRNRKLLLAAFLLLAFAGLKLVLLNYWQTQRPQIEDTVCDLSAGCRLPDGSVARATPIATGAPFDITLENVPSETSSVSVSFSMKNMDMGFNRYTFESLGGGRWQAANLRLPLCVEGRRDFIAEITIGSHTFQTAFSAK